MIKSVISFQVVINDESPLKYEPLMPAPKIILSWRSEQTPTSEEHLELGAVLTSALDSYLSRRKPGVVKPWPQAPLQTKVQPPALPKNAVQTPKK